MPSAKQGEFITLQLESSINLTKVMFSEKYLVMISESLLQYWSNEVVDPIQVAHHSTTLQADKTQVTFTCGDFTTGAQITQVNDNK